MRHSHDVVYITWTSHARSVEVLCDHWLQISYKQALRNILSKKLNKKNKNIMKFYIYTNKI